MSARCVLFGPRLSPNVVLANAALHGGGAFLPQRGGLGRGVGANGRFEGIPKETDVDWVASAVPAARYCPFSSSTV